MRKIILAALAAVAPVVAVADPIEDAIEARRGYYKLVNAEVTALAAMAKGAMDYDAAIAQARADNLVALTQYSTAHLWVPGSSKDDMPGKTRALPAIWENGEGVGAAAMQFVEAVNAMQAVAGQGKAEMAGALGALGGSCKNCHKDFRAQDF